MTADKIAVMAIKAATARGGSAANVLILWRNERWFGADEFTCRRDVSTLLREPGSTKGKLVRLLQRAFYEVHRKTVQAPRTQRITDSFVHLAGPAKSLLDVGAGNGHVAAEVARRIGALNVAGVDVLVQPDAAIPVQSYDGERIPFEDKSFEVVTISDVLHHCAKPREVLRECLRVASRCVLVKDHFCFGPLSNAMLWALDVAGNAEAGIFVRGTYFSPNQWIEMVRDAGGCIGTLEWPMQIHATPIRWITRDELQFAMRVEKA